MIGKVSRGAGVGGLLRYLFGPGRANEHLNPHLAAGWDRPTALEPVVGADGRRDLAPLTGLLEQPLRMDARPPTKPVWHCSLRVAPGDRRLSDAEWDDVARTVLDRVGLARRGEDHGCRWVAVRHAEDHVHLVVTLARQDGRRASTSNDYYRVGEACRAVEAQYGLTTTAARDRTVARRPSRGEQEKAHRAGHAEAARTQLQRTVRTTAATTGTPEDFLASLRACGLLVRERFSERTEGQVTGYAVALPGDRNKRSEPVWFGGGKLAPDLSWPQLQQRWEARGDSSAPARGAGERPPLTGPERAAAYRTAAHVARHAATEVRVLAQIDPAGARHAAAANADLLNVTARLVEGRAGGPLTTAADTFDRAAREPWGRIPPRSPDGQALRACARSLANLGRVRHGDGVQLLPLVAAIADLIDAVAALRTAQHRDAQADAARRAAATLRAVSIPIPAASAKRPMAPPPRRPPVHQPALWTAPRR